MRILLVEDDAETADYIGEGLREQGHQVSHAVDGRDGLYLAMSTTPELLIADRMLPGLDGLSMVRALRSAGADLPVLFLTALGGVDDRVLGLKAGGDDYLTKPFSFAELSARVEALARRPRALAPQTLLRVHDLEIDLLARSVRRGEQPIELQPREFRLLEYLARNAGQVVTRTMLLEHVWDLHFDPQTNVVDSHISRLRAKIDRDRPTALIHTVRGAGYRLDAG
ncbi:MAG: response regulator transcription factor [Pseudoxanthomonas sp.]